MCSAESELGGDARLPACPLLPDCPDGLDWRYLNDVRGDRGGAFYLRALTYGQHLWRRGLVARAILSVDRALGADLAGDEPELANWPLPYAALVWILKNAPADRFIGNPRVHFQHLADRVPEPRRAQRSARYWGCWALTRAARPELPGDPRHAVLEPELPALREALLRHGLPGEAELWEKVLAATGPDRVT